VGARVQVGGKQSITQDCLPLTSVRPTVSCASPIPQHALAPHAFLR
jgi:hypothetical protein